MRMSKGRDGANQRVELAGRVSWAELKTAQACGGKAIVDTKPAVRSKSRSKNLRAVPETYFEAHAQLKALNKTSLDFSAYILEALREKLENDGALKN